MEGCTPHLTPRTQVVHPALIPCCGADPLEPAATGLTTAMQLYVHAGAK